MARCLGAAARLPALDLAVPEEWGIMTIDPSSAAALRGDQALRPLLALPKHARDRLLAPSAKTERRQAYLARKAEQKVRELSRRNFKNACDHRKRFSAKKARFGRGRKGSSWEWELDLGNMMRRGGGMQGHSCWVWETELLGAEAFDHDNDFEFDYYNPYGDHWDANDAFHGNQLGYMEAEAEDVSNYSSLSVFGQCPLCLEARPLLKLNCSHSFCTPCLLRQLRARWGGLRVTSNYLKCSLCRESLAHQQLAVPLSVHEGFHRRVESIAVAKFREDGLLSEWQAALEYVPTQEMEEMVRSQASAVMAVFMCADCDQPFCGGRVDCAGQHELSPGQLRCNQCQWMSQNGQTAGHRCLVHGHRFAVYKCDFCCSVATYRCFGTTNFCARCHGQQGSRSYYPCPGSDACSLRIPHPCILSTDGEGAVKSFVLGCTACHGCTDDNTAVVQPGAEGEFGYPARRWQEFAGGDMLLGAVGEREVRSRLEHRASPELCGGSAAECAERLLLLELAIPSAEALLLAAGGGSEALARRLEAVGLRQDGLPLELASRLLLLRDRRLEDLEPHHLPPSDDECSDLPPLEDVGAGVDVSPPLKEEEELPPLQLRTSFKTVLRWLLSVVVGVVPITLAGIVMFNE